MIQPAMDGQLQGQADSPAENEVTDVDPGNQEPDRFAGLEARYDELSTGITDTQNMIAQLLASNQPKQAPVEEEFDDETPLTASRMKRVVDQAVGQAVSKSQAVNSRLMWDRKAKEDFPFDDPVFSRELNKNWKKFCSSGLDKNADKAMYLTAELTAQRLGVVNKPAASKAAEEQTSEAPTGGQPMGASSRKVLMVGADDQRVHLYNMRGTKTPEQLEAFRTKLAAADTRRKARR